MWPRWRTCWCSAFLISKSTNSYLTYDCHILAFSSFSTIRGKIDQVKGVLELDKESSASGGAGGRYGALEKWTHQLTTLHTAIANKMS